MSDDKQAQDQAPDGERIFHNTTDDACKFWAVQVIGDRQVVRFGRIGTDGQTHSKAFDDAASAQTATDKLIAQKVAKGYVGVSHAQAAAFVPPSGSSSRAAQRPAAQLALGDLFAETAPPEKSPVLSLGL